VIHECRRLVKRFFGGMSRWQPVCVVFGTSTSNVARRGAFGIEIAVVFALIGGVVFVVLAKAPVNVGREFLCGILLIALAFALSWGLRALLSHIWPVFLQ
jgi:hypothetical protein